MIGSIIPYTKSVVPEGYLVCDGSAVSRSEYSELFTVIGTTYGSGDGSSTFNLPNLSGCVAIGSSSGHAIGVGGGEETHSLIIDETPSHLHVIPAHGHGNDIVMATPQLSHSITAQPAFKYSQMTSAAARGIIGSGAHHFTSMKSASMSRSTSVGISDHPATACTMSGGITDCPAFNSEATGSGYAHNNMMPYIALVYLIQAEPETPPGPVIPSMVLYNGALPVTAGGAYIAGRR
jgi:microcystin-dependent protein